MRRFTRAMVLAAGLGSRMRPVTDDMPKPLVMVGGKPLIDHALDSLAIAGVETAVVNVHYRADQVVTHLAGRTTPRIVLSREEALMGTGGGIRRALPLLGDDPFYAMDCDALRLDGPTPALARLAAAWDDTRMDALILVVPTAKSIGMPDFGVMFLDPDGRARLPEEREIAPYAFASVQILAPRVFDGTVDDRFSYKDLWRRAQETGRLYGLVHDGPCLQVLTPEFVGLADVLLDGRRARWVEV
jgi:N-acetyl-alpha-D-muramate 1-phosphate uridylyltransferase